MTTNSHTTKEVLTRLPGANAAGQAGSISFTDRLRAVLRLQPPTGIACIFSCAAMMTRFFIIVVIVTTCFISGALFAQETQSGNMGVYLTGTDFVQHKLSDTIACNTRPAVKIRPHALFGRYKLDIIRNGQKKVYFKDELYGYRDCHQHDYRFAGMNDYLIIDTMGFYLYSSNNLVNEEKAARLAVQYYFSVTPDSPLLLLTLDNLEKAFSNNGSFRYALETGFKQNRQLMAYDPVLKEYKIKYLYLQTTAGNNNRITQPKNN